MDIITEVKASMTKLLENKIIDLEFNLNNKIVSVSPFIFLGDKNWDYRKKQWNPFAHSLKSWESIHYRL